MTTTQIISEPRRRTRKVTQTFALINAHAKREFRMIPKARLTIPVDDYQRNEAEGRIAAEIAQNFDWVAFGTLIVIHRTDGTLQVIDGGTRLNAALKRDDINELPCIVFSGLTAEEEAEVFLRVNENRRKLQVWQLQHAEVAARRALAIKAQSYLDSLHTARVGMSGLGVLRRCIKSHDLATSTVVDLLLTSAVDHHVSARILTGLVTLEVFLNKEDKTLKRRPIILRLQHTFGLLETAVSAVVTTKRRTDSRTLAQAVARTLKVRMPKGME